MRRSSASTVGVGLGLVILVGTACRPEPVTGPATSQEPDATQVEPQTKTETESKAEAAPEVEEPGARPETEPEPPSSSGADSPDLDDLFGSRGEAPSRSEPPPPDLSLRWLSDGGEPGPMVSPKALAMKLPKQARATMGRGKEPEPWRPSIVLDEASGLALVHERWGAIESTLLVVDAKKRVRGSKTFSRRVPDIGLADVLGDDTPELFVAVIDGTAMSSLPILWMVYRVTPRGGLVRVARIPKTYEYGSRRPQAYFRNTVTMPAKGTLRVETTAFSSRGPSPSKGSPRVLGEIYELRWNEDRARFERHAIATPPPEPTAGEDG